LLVDVVVVVVLVVVAERNNAPVLLLMLSTCLACFDMDFFSLIGLVELVGL
jgi:hypothetical protein